jgi:RNA polymerase sigma-70 factor (ECF subfamily)
MCQEERSLVQKIKLSDNNAFQTLFIKYQPVAFKFLYYRTRDYNLSQDIVQETFVKVWLNRASLKPELSFFSYLTRISNNLLKDHFKYLKVREKHKDSIPQSNPSFHDNPEDALDFHILHKQILAIVNKYLSDTARTIFFLSRIEDKSNEEIAETLGISKKKVENQLYYALKIIRKKLNRSPK